MAAARARSCDFNGCLSPLDGCAASALSFLPSFLRMMPKNNAMQQDVTRQNGSENRPTIERAASEEEAIASYQLAAY